VAQLDYCALGQRIRAFRKKNNMTQEKLGEICDLSAAHIGHIERGTRIPSLETVFLIASCLGISVDMLLFDSIENKDSLFITISKGLEGKDDAKAKSYISTVKTLFDNIDDL